MILVNLSGGIDSTGMLFKLLTTTSHSLVAHHCSITSERQRGEYKAVEAIIVYCKENCRSFECIYSEVDLPFNNDYAPDMLLWSTIGAYIIAQDKRITATARGWSTVYNKNFNPNSRKVLDILYSQTTNRDIVQLYPIEGLTKQEVLAYVPKELRKYLWACREPINYEQCRNCKSCKEAEEANK